MSHQEINNTLNQYFPFYSMGSFVNSNLDLCKQEFLAWQRKLESNWKEGEFFENVDSIFKRGLPFSSKITSKYIFVCVEQNWTFITSNRFPFPDLFGLTPILSERLCCKCYLFGHSSFLFENSSIKSAFTIYEVYNGNSSLEPLRSVRNEYDLNKWRFEEFGEKQAYEIEYNKRGMNKFNVVNIADYLEIASGHSLLDFVLLNEKKKFIVFDSIEAFEKSTQLSFDQARSSLLNKSK